MVDAKDRPKMVMGIVERLGKKKAGADEPSDADEPESDDESAKEAAGTELADALKSGDGAEIYRSFESLMELCRTSAK